MVLTKTEARAAATELEQAARTEWVRLRRFVRYARGKQKLPWLPDNAETEYRDIAVKSASNWLDLVVRATIQGLHVAGYGTAASMEDDSPSVWDRVWQPNGMDARQHALHRAVETLGYSFLLVLPSEDSGVWMRPEAATRMFVEFDDPGDEWPVRALRQVSKTRWELYDDEARYTLDGGLGAGSTMTVLEHNLAVCPVVQMQSNLDLLGTPMGEIEPVIPIQDRIVDATFTLQMAAKYGAFPQRWIAGINPGEPLRDSDGAPLLDAAGNPIMPTIKAYIDHVLMAADPETKFGQFAAADLSQYVQALEAHIRHLAAITQTPPHYLLGALVNLSAEALAAAEAGLQRKIRGKREVLGEGYEQAFRLSAAVLGDEAAAHDTSSQVMWQDVESRSLAQVADALTKIKTLGVPAQMLFEMIPSWTEQDVARAVTLIKEGDGIDALIAELTAGATSPPPAP